MKTTVEFNEQAAEALDGLAEELGSPSKSEIIRNALALYAFIMDDLRQGRDLAIVEGDTIRKVIAVPGVPIRTRRAAAAAR